MRKSALVKNTLNLCHSLDKFSRRQNCYILPYFLENRSILIYHVNWRCVKCQSYFLRKNILKNVVYWNFFPACYTWRLQRYTVFICMGRWFSRWMSLNMRNRTLGHVRQMKFSLSTWRKFASLAIQNVPNKSSGQLVRMHKLICILTGCNLCFLMLWLNSFGAKF